MTTMEDLDSDPEVQDIDPPLLALDVKSIVEGSSYILLTADFIAAAKETKTMIKKLQIV
jgi:hypothetical protein